MNMEETGNDAVLLFDTLYTTNHIQMLKVLLPYIESEQRNKIALLIKFQELQYTLRYTKSHTISLLASEEEKNDKPDLVKMLSAILPYCTEAEQKMFKQLLNLKSNMDRYQEMAQMMKLLEPILSSDDSKKEDSAKDDMNLSSILSAMMSPEQMELFKTFQEGANSTS